MILGATAAAIDIIKRGFPDDCDAMEEGLLIFFSLGRWEGAQRDSLSLGAHEPSQLKGAPKVVLDGLEVYFSVPDEYAEMLKNCILHFNSYTKEFEPLEVVIADK